MAASIGTGHPAFSKRSNRIHAPSARCVSRPPNGFTATVGTWRLSVGAGQVSKNSAVLGGHENAAKELLMRSRYIDHGEKGANIPTLGGRERVFTSSDFTSK